MTTLSGPNAPALAQNVAGIGTTAWTNPGNAAASDDAYATISEADSQWLRAIDFGFAIPDEHTIFGVQVDVELRSTNSSRASDAGARLVVSNAVVGSDLAKITGIPTSEGLRTYGGPTELWGLALTPAIVNSTNFGFAYAANAAAATTVSVDAISMTVAHGIPGVFQVVSTSLQTRERLARVAATGRVVTDTAGLTGSQARSRSIWRAVAATLGLGASPVPHAYTALKVIVTATLGVAGGQARRFTRGVFPLRVRIAARSYRLRSGQQLGGEER